MLRPIRLPYTGCSSRIFLGFRDRQFRKFCLNGQTSLKKGHHAERSLPGRLNEADLCFARENDMKVSDHTGGVEKRVSDFIIAVPTTFD